MTRRVCLAAMVFAAAVLVAAAAFADRQPQPVELIDALESGSVEAVFYGNGDSSVRARLRRSSFGPELVYVAPGTQFWAQETAQEGDFQGQGGGGGVQGMSTIGRVPIDLSRRTARLDIPTACTNYDLPAPTHRNRMIPVRCPDRRMAAVSEQIARMQPSRPAAQLAVWAIANDPTWAEVEEHVEDDARADTARERAERLSAYRDEAARVLHAAGLHPLWFRMFQ